MTAALAALSAVFVAEFGDKSQLITAGFATRHGRGVVAAAVTVAAAAVQAVSVAVGALVGDLLEPTAVTALAAAAFLAVAAWTLVETERDGTDTATTDATGGPSPATGAAATYRSSVRTGAVIAGTFAVGEIGDKTMLATFALAARNGPLATWAGATVGMVAANLIALEVGRRVGDRFDRRTIGRVTAGLFAAVAVALLVGLAV